MQLYRSCLLDVHSHSSEKSYNRKHATIYANITSATANTISSGKICWAPQHKLLLLFFPPSRIQEQPNFKSLKQSCYCKASSTIYTELSQRFHNRQFHLKLLALTHRMRWIVCTFLATFFQNLPKCKSQGSRVNVERIQQSIGVFAIDSSP